MLDIGSREDIVRGAMFYLERQLGCGGKTEYGMDARRLLKLRSNQLKDVVQISSGGYGDFAARRLSERGWDYGKRYSHHGSGQIYEEGFRHQAFTLSLIRDTAGGEPETRRVTRRGQNGSFQQ